MIVITAWGGWGPLGSPAKGKPGYRCQTSYWMPKMCQGFTAQGGAGLQSSQGYPSEDRQQESRAEKDIK